MLLSIMLLTLTSAIVATATEAIIVAFIVALLSTDTTVL
jgi:hypothetical protein